MVNALRERLGPVGRDLWRLLAVAAIGRVHVAGLGLAVLLVVEDATGSLAAAGSAAGALSLGVGATRPVQGRLIDRWGRAVMPVVCVPHAAITGALLAPGTVDARVLTVLAFAAGFTSPALSVVTRSVIASRVPAVRQPAVLGADTALQDCAFALGPLIAGTLAAAVSPAAAVAALVGIGCAGALGVAAVAPLERAAIAVRAFARPDLRPIARPLLVTVGHGTVYGALSVAGVATVLETGGEHLTGAAVAAVFAGGLIGDLVIAARRPRKPPPVRLRVQTPALAAVVALTAAAPSVPLLLPALVACGVALAAVGVTVLLDVSARTGERGRAEAFGWTGATLRLGDAVGATCAGVVAEHAGAQASLLVGAAGAAVAVAAAVTHRGAGARRLVVAAATLVAAALTFAAAIGPFGLILALAGSGLVVLGAGIGRLRVASVPLVAALGLAALAVAAPPPDLDEQWRPLLATVIVLLGGGASLCLMLGALVRRLGRPGGRGSSSPGEAAG